MMSPSSAVVSTAKNNAFGHPAKALKQRYELRNIQWFNTADHGYISWHTKDGKILSYTDQRKAQGLW